MRHSQWTLLRTITVAVALLAPALVVEAAGASAIPSVLTVPTEHPTIQAAIDAAAPGDTVRVRAGTYREQLVITKDLTIRGAGREATIIHAPTTLVPGQLGSPSIVEIYGGAKATMSHLTVAGPGEVACGAVDGDGDEVPRLRWGIRVHTEGHLELRHAAVRDIHDTPMAPCPRSGAAIVIGSPVPGAPTASADIRHVEVTNYQVVGIIAFGFGSWATITHSVVAGPGHEGGVPTDGIELVAGAVGRVAHNTVSGNVCPAGMPEDCGPDFFSQFQHAGILTDGGAGTVISHNRVIGNQIGLYLSEADRISHNELIDNEFFAIGLVGLNSGRFTLAHERIRGGGGGIWVVPLDPVDMTVDLRRVTFADLGGPAVEVLACTPATATVNGGPPPVAGQCPP